jgi:ubiquinone/menaquinone biosynthesis C-methylase UbiE
LTRDDRLALLSDGVAGGVWADLGSGTGAFTFALAERLGPSGRIYSVDQDQRALREQKERLEHLSAHAPGSLPEIEIILADFTDVPPLPELDGVLFANSLHFQRDACAVVRVLSHLLKPGGRVLVVEYDVRRASPWVPYPLPSGSFAAFTECAGLVAPRLIATRPSAYHGRAYSAVAQKPGR